MGWEEEERGKREPSPSLSGCGKKKREKLVKRTGTGKTSKLKKGTKKGRRKLLSCLFLHRVCRRGGWARSVSTGAKGRGQYPSGLGAEDDILGPEVVRW